MKLKNEDIITLNNDEKYVVVSTAIYEKEIYVYIVNINNNEKFKIAKIKKDKLIEVPDDKELVRKLIVLFYENSIKNLDLNVLIRQGLKIKKI
jgi:hypothetical protein